jgi:hypothetical protein
MSINDSTLALGGDPAGDDQPRGRIDGALDHQRKRPAAVGVADE